MSPLDSTGILLEGVRAALRPVLQVERRRTVPEPDHASQEPRAQGSQRVPQSAFRALEAYRSASQPEAAPTSGTIRQAASSSYAPAYALAAPQATIRQAEMLLQITAAAASSPAMRQIAAAAYQMELDARRELARIHREGAAPVRQWFA